MEHKGTVRLETQRLVLRKFIDEDITPSFYNWTGDDRVTEFLRWKTHDNVNVTYDVINDWIKKYNCLSFYQWAIVLKDLNEPIGTISVVDSDEKIGKVHIGYCIGSKWWNRGYTSEAFGAVIKFLFNEVKVIRIESQHDPNNPGSGKVMKKCGLVYEGTLKKSDWSNKGIVDACLYGLVADDYYD